MSETISKASVCEILADIYPTDGEKVVSVKEIDKAYEAIQQLPSAQPYTDEEIQKMQDLEQAQIQKAYELGREEAQPEQQWIPCSERLPEKYEDIIVTYVDDEETRIIPVNYGKGTWYDCIFDTALNPIKVIAWMPLPEPYKGDAE